MSQLDEMTEQQLVEAILDILANNECPNKHNLPAGCGVPCDDCQLHAVKRAAWAIRDLRAKAKAKEPYKCPHGYTNSDDCPDCCH